jgi:hypothetical protein
MPGGVPDLVSGIRSCEIHLHGPMVEPLLGGLWRRSAHRT